MSDLSELGKAFEKKTKEAVSNTEQNVLSEFGKLEKNIVEELKSSQNRCESFIQDQNRYYQKLLVRSWWPIGALLLVLSLIMGFIIYGLGLKIKSDYTEYQQLQSQLEELQSRWPDLVVRNCEGRPCVRIDSSAAIYEEKKTKEPLYIIKN